MKNENSIDLPMEIWQKIFRFLDKKCRKNATLTCRKWFKIIRHDTIQSGMDLFISGQNTLKRSSTNYTPRLGFIHRLNWQCYLAGSSKTAPRILIFSIAIGADYSFDIKSGFSIAPAFSLHNNFDIASVYKKYW